MKNVAGEKITLTGLVPESVYSHTFELVPSDVIKVNDADLVIIDMPGLATNEEDVVDEAQNTKPDLQILKLGGNAVTPDQFVFDFSFPEEEGDPNPHLWLNVAYAMKFANFTRDKLLQKCDKGVSSYMYHRSQHYTPVSTSHYPSTRDCHWLWHGESAHKVAGRLPNTPLL